MTPPKEHGTARLPNSDQPRAGEAVELKPCPFCGGELVISKHFRDPLWRGTHRCSAVGAISFDWSASPESIADLWNARDSSAPPDEGVREAALTVARLVAGYRLTTEIDAAASRLQAALTHPEGQGGWRPIETAVRDGRQVLLGGWRNPPNGRYWYIEKGHIEAGFSVPAKATHYMELPPAPKPEEG